jgi:hypothetical protein
MARPPSGPLGNSPRDLREDFVGEEAQVYKTGEPPKKTRKPKRVKSNTFHAKVTGATSHKRADRASYFRSGGFVKYAGGGSVKRQEGGMLEEEPTEPEGGMSFKRGGGIKRQQGGSSGPPPLSSDNMKPRDTEPERRVYQPRKDGGSIKRQFGGRTAVDREGERAAAQEARETTAKKIVRSRAVPRVAPRIPVRPVRPVAPVGGFPLRKGGGGVKKK